MTTLTRIWSGARAAMRGDAPGRVFAIALAWLGAYGLVVFATLLALLATNPDQPADRLLFLVVSAASNVAFKISVDPATGLAAVQSDPSDPTRVLEIAVGKNPRGIVVNSTDTLAYVMNYVSRDVSVIDLTASPEHVVATLKSADLPLPGTLADEIHVGRELYNTSVGVLDPATPDAPRDVSAHLCDLSKRPSPTLSRNFIVMTPLQAKIRR